MATAVLPTVAELPTLGTVDAVRQWTGLSQPVWDVLSQSLGTVPNLRVLASMPWEPLNQALRTARIAPTPPATQPRELTIVEAVQVGLMWRVARQVHGLDDIDPSAPVQRTTAAAPIAAAATTSVKKVKTASVLDQMDETEVNPLSQNQMDVAYLNHIEITGADPPADAERTPEQLAALYARVVERGEAPYADFSVLTPFGRRMAKQMKARGWMLQQDGSFKALDIPGPPTFDTWAACWKVYRAGLFMLRHPPATPGNPPLKVVTAAALEEYYERVVKLNAEFPETWHLLMQAEDRCRAEMLERYRRQLAKALVDGRLPMGMEFSPASPWIGVFMYAARDSAYWDEHVVRPSQSFLARGGKKMTLENASKTNMPEPAKDIMDGVTDAIKDSPPGQGASRQAKKRRRDREDKTRWDWSMTKSWEVGKGTSSASSLQQSGAKKGQPYQKAKGGLYSHNSDGCEICYRFAKGAAGACPEPCRDQRDHACQICLGRHNNASCPRTTKAGGKAEGSGGNGKGWKK